MEHKSAGGSNSKNVQGANSISIDKSRSSSASSVSVASATSAELSSEDSNDIDRNIHGKCRTSSEKNSFIGNFDLEIGPVGSGIQVRSGHANEYSNWLF